MESMASPLPVDESSSWKATLRLTNKPNSKRHSKAVPLGPILRVTAWTCDIYTSTVLFTIDNIVSRIKRL